MTAPEDDLRDLERQCIRALAKAGRQVDLIERRSERLCDLTVHGTYTAPSIGGMDTFRFSGWLPLSVIRELVQWNTATVALLTDCPAMALKGEWSAVRDTDPAKIWMIFTLHGLPAVDKFSPRRQPCRCKEPQRHSSCMACGVANMRWGYPQSVCGVCHEAGLVGKIIPGTSSARCAIHKTTKISPPNS